eukprot:g2635.t1
MAGTDFYLHVNKKWLVDPANKIPNEYSQWGGFTKLHDEGLKKQIQLVKDLEQKADRNEEEEKIFAIWKASCQRFSMWEKGEGSFLPIANEMQVLEDILDLKTPFADDEDFVTRIARYIHYTQTNGIGNVVDFDKGSDLKNVNNVVLDFSVCGLSLPSREYYFDDNFATKRELFKTHLQNVVKLVNENDTENQVKLSDTFVQDIIDFENELASYLMKRAQSREYDRYYTNSTLTEMYEKINDLNSLPEKETNYEEANRNYRVNDDTISKIKVFFETCYKLFNFREVLLANKMQHFQYDSNGPNEEQCTTFDGDGIRRVLTMILDQKKFNKYKSYMQYKIICKVFGFCSKDFDDEFFNFYQREMRGQAEQKTNDKRSINVVNAYAGEMMGKVFCAKYFTEDSKEDVKKMILETLDIMKVSIQNNDWLTAETKAKANEKLSKFRLKIGYPDVWKDYSDFNAKVGDSLYEISKKATKWKLNMEFFRKLNSVLDREEWRMTPQTVNAYFMPTQNEIVFPAAILQPPFYHKDSSTVDFDVNDERKLDESIDLAKPANFGGIGAVIAHEITHGYDDKGRKFDGDGNLNDWWQEEDAALFKGKTEIMAKSAEKYEFIDTEDHNKLYKMNPKLCMGENLADLGGLSLSLQALLKSVEGQSQNKVKASLRILFKSWANVWKLNIKKDSRINRLTTDPHAPCEFRGNLVQHMDEFYDAFDITQGDKMYLEKESRVRMW